MLLALTQAGVSREDAYRIVQKAAMQAWENGSNFLEILSADAEVTQHLTHAALAAEFDDAYHLKHVGTIFARVFGD